MTRTEYRKNRQTIISRNRSLRLTDPSKVQPTPPRLPNIMGWELYDDGDYYGFVLDEGVKDEYVAKNKNRTAKKVQYMNDGCMSA